MIIRCFRCSKDIATPSERNADYIIAGDTVAREEVDVLVALRHNMKTLEKRDTELAIDDSEYDEVEVPSFSAVSSIVPAEDLVKVVARKALKDIQKTGIVCPTCYRPTDTVIWGVHKK